MHAPSHPLLSPDSIQQLLLISQHWLTIGKPLMQSQADELVSLERETKIVMGCGNLIPAGFVLDTGRCLALLLIVHPGARFDPLFSILTKLLKKMYVHALHTVHVLPDLRVAGGRLGDGVAL